MQYGYAGTILRVDLATGITSPINTEEYAPLFLGGRGFAAKLYWDEVEPETEAFDEKNKLMFMLGPLAGIPAIGGSRWGVYGKSALNIRHSFNYGNLGGTFGAELKFAGYDGMVIQGKSDKPVYIHIQDDSVTIKSASHLWGKNSIETRKILQQELGPKTRVVSIGQAGENLVSNAIVLADGDASGSGGLGAVMGSKNCKAVAVTGTNRKVPVADMDRIRELAKYIHSLGRGNVKVWGVDFMAHGPRTKKAPCYGCMGDCLRVNYTADNGKQGKFMCQSRFFYFAQSLIYHQADNDVPFMANKLCDEYGIDTWVLEETMKWFINCYHEGLITEEEAEIPLSKVGSWEFIEALTRKIAFREGIGDILAGGVHRAAEEFGEDSKKLIRSVDPYEPRLYLTNALIFPFEPREPIQQVHEVGLSLAQWATSAKGIPGSSIDTDVLFGIAKKFWGSEKAADMTTYEGKALAARMIQDRQYAKESLITCDWMYPVLDRPNMEDRVGEPDMESKVISAVMGKDISEDELNRYGERVFNLQRAVLLRDGHRALEDDMLPDEWHTQPLESHIADPDCLAPGADREPVSRKGSLVNKDDYTAILKEYYELRGWNTNTGLQTRKQMHDLDLSDIWDELESQGMSSPAN